MSSIDYCKQAIHVRDPLTGDCEYCGDTKGWATAHQELVANEPPRGAVVLTEGPTGTAWQRFQSDGLWHSGTGKKTSWGRLTLADRPGSRVLVVYLPPEPRP